MPINYNCSKIYKIVDNTNGNIYIGSTTQKLTQRLGEHTRKYKLYCNEKYGYTSSFDIIKNDNYEIILVQEVNCNNKEQLLKIEREHIEANKCVNLNLPSRTYKEHYEANKEKRKEQMKQYYDLNRDKIREQQQKYRENNEYSKYYYEANKKKICDKKKQYYEAKKKEKEANKI